MIFYHLVHVRFTTRL